MNDDTTTSVPKFADMTPRVLVGIALGGLLTGALMYGLSLLLEKIVIAPALCGGADQSTCASSDVVSLHIAAIVAGIIGVALLARLSVYRPLLVVIAVTIGLWQLSALSLDLVWYYAVAGLAVAHMLAYLAFSWILRIYNLIIAILATVLLTLAMILIPRL